jgi:F-type H+-transporting ATPase subunit b
LRKQVAALAVVGAEQILGREVDSQAHSRLLDELATQL